MRRSFRLFPAPVSDQKPGFVRWALDDGHSPFPTSKEIRPTSKQITDVKTHQDEAFFSLRISFVAQVDKVFVLLVFDRRPFVNRLVMDSFSTSGKILTPNAVHKSLKQM